MSASRLAVVRAMTFTERGRHVFGQFTDAVEHGLFVQAVEHHNARIEVLAEHDRLAGQVAAVVGLHEWDEGTDGRLFCRHCSYAYGRVPWPCPTVGLLLDAEQAAHHVRTTRTQANAEESNR
ncbi:hypothetical protein B4N89_13615 [Embleya scabrispora]|uniref:Uncharacterized protein n=1 Tax=Embleya scabrispora TaxID=159449 RepID=A0A1T3NYL5_9ACTN|nr:hypothetical protein [Embleya scabrispora]OPC81835.1 hypothetical protein B4N89_13615 [Embleya scabrispora]